MPDQVEAIRGWLRERWRDLSPDQVTLVDADGRLNFKQRANGGSGSSDAAAAEVEQAMEAKLVAMLEPLAGRDNVRATVNVSYEQGSEERTDEVYDPSQVVALTMQKSDQSSRAACKGLGCSGYGEQYARGLTGGCSGWIEGCGCAGNSAAVAEGGAAGVSAAECAGTERA